MEKRCRIIPGTLVLLGILSFGGSTTRGQSPTIDTPDPISPGGDSSTLGRSPGSGGAGPSSGQDSQILGGRVGPTTPKGVPSSISTPGTRSNISIPGDTGIRPIEDQAPAAIPVSGPLALPPGAENPGPADGLTLDDAIIRLIRDNLDLRGKAVEIPQARADALTASLRANPVFYADAQLVPYGQYTRNRPGGQTQYDVNISYPLDLSRKRIARIASAFQATKVIEAQYQDAVRLTIDNLYTAYVDALQARRTIDFAEAGVLGANQALKSTEALFRRGQVKASAVSRYRIQQRTGQQQLDDSRQAYVKAKRALGALLNSPPDQDETLELNGVLKFPKIDLPPLPELIDMAVNTRPDVASYKIGVLRAQADVRLQLANRFQDVYLLYQPYTLQDNTPFGLKSPISWAVGVTVPLPIYNRNQGNIERARLNVGQTKVELSDEIRQTIQDVKNAEGEYQLARTAVDRLETDILPDSETVFKEAERLYPAEMSELDYLGAVRDRNENIRSYLEATVRLRRAMLDLNTAVGRRILP